GSKMPGSSGSGNSAGTLTLKRLDADDFDAHRLVGLTTREDGAVELGDVELQRSQQHVAALRRVLDLLQPLLELADAALGDLRHSSADISRRPVRGALGASTLIARLFTGRGW